MHLTGLQTREARPLGGASVSAHTTREDNRMGRGLCWSPTSPTTRLVCNLGRNIAHWGSRNQLVMIGKWLEGRAVVKANRLGQSPRACVHTGISPLRLVVYKRKSVVSSGMKSVKNGFHAARGSSLQKMNPGPCPRPPGRQGTALGPPRPEALTELQQGGKQHSSNRVRPGGAGLAGFLCSRATAHCISARWGGPARR